MKTNYLPQLQRDIDVVGGNGLYDLPIEENQQTQTDMIDELFYSKQSLESQLKQKDAEIAELKKENEELKAEMTAHYKFCKE